MQLRAFHNVCRHRAYAVTKKECGSSTVLGCRYHGWSYNTKGNLIKAPEFENVPGFDRGKNGLWEVKTAVQEGMVFINFDATGNVEDLNLGQSGRILKTWGLAMMKCIAEWKVEAAVNWKSLGIFFPREVGYVLIGGRLSWEQRGWRYAVVVQHHPSSVSEARYGLESHQHPYHKKAWFWNSHSTCCVSEVSKQNGY